MLGSVCDGPESAKLCYRTSRFILYRWWPAASDAVLRFQQTQARRWWIGSLKLAIGLESSFPTNPADGLVSLSSWESGFHLELLAPYLRLFSFCDYTIAQPARAVHSQIQQRCHARFVQGAACPCSIQRGIINMLGRTKIPAAVILRRGLRYSKGLFSLIASNH